MKTFGLFALLSLLTGNPLLALVILLIIFFFAENRFIGILPDFFGFWRKANRTRQLNREIRVNPYDAEAHLELGETYFRKGKYQLAFSSLEKASTKMQGHPLFHFYRGAACYHLGKTEEGRKEIEKAIEINPKVSFGEPYMYLVQPYLMEKKPGPEIDSLFNQLLHHGTPRTFYEAGKLFLGAGDKRRARLLFRETIDNYEACRGSMRRLYRKWAILAKMNLPSTRER